MRGDDELYSAFLTGAVNAASLCASFCINLLFWHKSTENVSIRLLFIIFLSPFANENIIRLYIGPPPDGRVRGPRPDGSFRGAFGYAELTFVITLLLAPAVVIFEKNENIL